MKGLLLDTHIWIWKIKGDPALPSRVSRVLDERASECWLSPVSVWELAMLAAKDRVRLEPSTKRFAARALGLHALREAALTFEVAERASELLNINDPADTLIAATALTYDLTLVTLDRKLKRVAGLRTLPK